MRLTVVCDKKIESSKSLRTVLIEKSEKKCQTVTSYQLLFYFHPRRFVSDREKKRETEGKPRWQKQNTWRQKFTFFFYLRNEVKLLMTTRVYCFSIKQTDCVRLHFGKALWMKQCQFSIEFEW